MNSQKRNEYQIELPDGVTMDFVYVPAGEFIMGAAVNEGTARLYEKPIHTVYLDGYWIGKYPVINEQYRVYVKHGKGEEPEYADRFLDPQKKHHPVVGISWYDAEKYCQWLSQYSGEQVGLPTEAQWEKAARGTDERIFPWGNKETGWRANYNSVGDPREIVNDTTQVGSYPAGVSPYGAHDMAGNVWEWVADWFDEDFYRWDNYFDKPSPYKNPTGPPFGKWRVLRGGSWGQLTWFVRVYSRFPDRPDSKRDDYGFRVMRREAA